MKRKLLTLLSSALLLIGIMGISASPVAATGNCNTGYVQFWQDANFTGATVKMCWNIYDGNWLDSLGPDINGVYKTGWHDKLSSFKVRAPAGYGVCLYRNELYSSLWHQSQRTEDWNVDIFNNDQTDSFKWAALSPINGLAAC
jgi:hypothetical protein